MDSDFRFDSTNQSQNSIRNHQNNQQNSFYPSEYPSDQSLVQNELEMINKLINSSDSPTISSHLPQDNKKSPVPSISSPSNPSNEEISSGFSQSIQNNSQKITSPQQQTTSNQQQSISSFHSPVPIPHHLSSLNENSILSGNPQTNAMIRNFLKDRSIGSNNHSQGASASNISHSSISRSSSEGNVLYPSASMSMKRSYDGLPFNSPPSSPQISNFNHLSIFPLTNPPSLPFDSSLPHRNSNPNSPPPQTHSHINAQNSLYNQNIPIYPPHIPSHPHMNHNVHNMMSNQQQIHNNYNANSQISLSSYNQQQQQQRQMTQLPHKLSPAEKKAKTSKGSSVSSKQSKQKQKTPPIPSSYVPSKQSAHPFPIHSSPVAQPGLIRGQYQNQLNNQNQYSHPHQQTMSNNNNNINNLIQLEVPPQQGMSECVVSTLGTIVYDDERYHTKDIIYPVGFSSYRIFASLLKVGTTNYWRCEIAKGDKGPVFMIHEDPSGSDMMVDSDLNTLLLMLKSKFDALNIKLPNFYWDGALFFGIKLPVVMQKIESLPNVDRLRNYKRNTLDTTVKLTTENNNNSINNIINNNNVSNNNIPLIQNPFSFPRPVTPPAMMNQMHNQSSVMNGYNSVMNSHVSLQALQANLASKIPNQAQMVAAKNYVKAHRSKEVKPENYMDHLAFVERTLEDYPYFPAVSYSFKALLTNHLKEDSQLIERYYYLLKRLGAILIVDGAQPSPKFNPRRMYDIFDVAYSRIDVWNSNQLAEILRFRNMAQYANNLYVANHAQQQQQQQQQSNGQISQVTAVQTTKNNIQTVRNGQIPTVNTSAPIVKSSSGPIQALKQNSLPNKSNQPKIMKPPNPAIIKRVRDETGFNNENVIDFQHNLIPEKIITAETIVTFDAIPELFKGIETGFQVVNGEEMIVTVALQMYDASGGNSHGQKPAYFLHVNGAVLPPKYQYREPIHINRMVKSGKNWIRIALNPGVNNSSSFLFTVVYKRYRPLNTLLYQVKKGVRPSRSVIINAIKGSFSYDKEVEQITMPLSLRCPITREKIILAERHHQTFP
eukprot:TRINITY_DN4594_c1_g1_i3.p1 TRINITY_DN4594_c1_g1~~TRINITY_DN4594_c1_g1_i3.p1  ORF type:complete len:1052 (+),score=318.25 TRINITY_DN4594_c1_g1_i3:250-3405(+)